MEHSLTEIRDSFYCGFLDKARDSLSEIKQSPQFSKSDSLFVRDVELLSLQCDLAAASNFEQVETAHPELSLPEQVIYNASICMSSKTSPLEKLTAFTFLKTEHANNSSQLDPSSKALIAFVMGVMSPAGEAATDSSDLGSINSAISAIVASGGVDTAAYKIILFLLADRPDLALKIHSRALMSTDESVVPQLMQAWMSLVKGNWQEAFLSVQDIESILGTDSDNTSWRLNCLRGLARLHSKQFEEAAGFLKTAAESCKNSDASVLVSLIAALQNLGRSEEAAAVTENLRQVLEPSSTYWAALNQLKTVAAKFDQASVN
eukprot:Gregarina_sp_Pseudo_9__896@NODE_1574_length_1483_cov_22_286704_g1460_i0_p1_GENE_NODE_1574_length_1483_cov_22_286704_g1460_i0NODE_1574_length_1483_cov_22_286704_g1460_i0_p1_ORF_typecomplete_len319_score53_10Coatomer_E/PF04733_14/1_5e21TPR_15/PF13429_6/3_8e03TPR_15/PF13429_6/8e06TPR_MalT/PF17874_1/1_9e05TPR_19/PF14559_6/4_7e03TPR_19/PF14559_6/7e03TPR_19/PF14559_6/0_39TPR_19/PF14559_6/0_011Cohesin_load/PF10345_9/1_9e03Cohesin_load/PF10345_9/0_00011TPR_16/PF13432_6/2_3e02TPR_16/PF13432_6/0_52TPR_16/